MQGVDLDLPHCARRLDLEVAVFLAFLRSCRSEGKSVNHMRVTSDGRARERCARFAPDFLLPPFPHYFLSDPGLPGTLFSKSITPRFDHFNLQSAILPKNNLELNLGVYFAEPHRNNFVHPQQPCRSAEVLPIIERRRTRKAPKATASCTRMPHTSTKEEGSVTTPTSKMKSTTETAAPPPLSYFHDFLRMCRLVGEGGSVSKERERCWCSRAMQSTPHDNCRLKLAFFLQGERRDAIVKLRQSDGRSGEYSAPDCLHRVCRRNNFTKSVTSSSTLRYRAMHLVPLHPNPTQCVFWGVEKTNKKSSLSLPALYARLPAKLLLRPKKTKGVAKKMASEGCGVKTRRRRQ